MSLVRTVEGLGQLGPMVSATQPNRQRSHGFDRGTCGENSTCRRPLAVKQCALERLRKKGRRHDSERRVVDEEQMGRFVLVDRMRVTVSFKATMHRSDPPHMYLNFIMITFNDSLPVCCNRGGFRYFRCDKSSLTSLVRLQPWLRLHKATPKVTGEIGPA